MREKDEREVKRPGRQEDVARALPPLVSRIAGAVALTAALALGATGAGAAGATLVVVALMEFAASRVAVKRSRGESETSPDPGFGHFTGQIP